MSNGNIEKLIALLKTDEEGEETAFLLYHTKGSGNSSVEEKRRNKNAFIRSA